MIVSEIVDALNGKILSGKTCCSREIAGVYICDLLSWTMIKAQKGDVWITVQNNINIVIISSLIELSCIIIAENIVIDETILKMADEKDVIIISSDESSFSIAKKLSTIV
jgi:predicted transcriptional regulator